MKRTILLITCCLICAFVSAKRHVPLDPSDPVVFKGSYILYRNQKIVLNEKNIYLDATLTEKDCKKHQYVYRTFQEVVAHLKAGTGADDRMTIYVAPYVYWVDDPDDPAIRRPEPGSGSPIGMHIRCPWLRIMGLTQQPQHVIFASNRGQSQGSYGNFTMFYFHGDGLSLNNLTFANYCNIDLEYPLLPALNRKKRMDAITQAQLAFADGDRLEAHNCHFISRLNTCPLNGGKRTLFENCHFESTDDALCSNGVYVHCDFDFYGTMPFGHTNKTGAVMFDCDLRTIVSELDIQRTHQHLIKGNGNPLTLIDCRFHTPQGVQVGWTPNPQPFVRYYLSNVTHNGRPARMSEEHPEVTVDITGKPLLQAYKVRVGEKVIYNTYNLLSGNDGWDPLHVKEQILQEEQRTGRSLHNLPTFLGVSQRTVSLEEGQPSVEMSVVAETFDQRPVPMEGFYWHTQRSDLANIHVSKDGFCQVESVNQTDSVKTTLVDVTTDYGLQSALSVVAAPRTLAAPHFTQQPVITRQQSDKLLVSYQLDSSRPDHSLITWYRCDDCQGHGAKKVSESRLDQPEYTYRLQPADEGKYILASISPKTIRSHEGTPVHILYNQVIQKEDIQQWNIVETDFQNFPADDQTALIPGCWTIDGYKPKDTDFYDWQAKGNNWKYMSGSGGHHGYGLCQLQKGARLRYTPTKEQQGDMDILLKVDVGKEIGQGFASATGQYLDICIRFDTETLTGYALRIIRTTKYANAVDMQLMRYDHGNTTMIGEPVSTTCFISPCTIHVWTKGNQLRAHVETAGKQRKSELADHVDLQTTMQQEPYYGAAFQFTGSCGGSAIMFHYLRMEWGK